ncbi:hypothetical protein CVT26_007630 [Gymnopilus dilepis]|uniref:Uncharacterized protein n=1 Tax=Gymnopilus dilepis TaxID=231916 RepID=A0A409VZM9_9AGAR|nr:hypothetical protein CVT26_007630 [Gymnopilus dilepis]
MANRSAMWRMRRAWPGDGGEKGGELDPASAPLEGQCLRSVEKDGQVRIDVRQQGMDTTTTAEPVGGAATAHVHSSKP